MERPSGAPEEPSGAPEEPIGAPEHSEERDAKRRCATEPEREYHELFAMLSRRAPTTKEIESAVAGEPPCVVERSLPSFFDSYPRSKRAALVLAEAGRWDDALRVLRAAEAVLLRGDLAGLEKEIAAALGESDDGLVDLSVEEDGGDAARAPASSESAAAHRWQVDGGDTGWIDFADATSQDVEAAFAARAKTVAFSGPSGGRYEVDLERLVQRNLANGYVRPVRRVVS